VLNFSTPPTRGSSQHHQQWILADIDDDELSKNRPIRIKARDHPPTWEPKFEDGGKREDSKLTNVRGEKHMGKE
jgi:hypothetical protein